ncbi:winged helix-turn-helix transcriptional regulator [Mycobacterium asiaticum]|uniref:winged helix-turn-helix transcriptional regulator n=1 Tax=Mycobacterium asiaticum TaxID=1790 RepID=UPI0005679A22|nr:helix-turn-helix domain-containing protein [Mycobacterium asiaticum]ORA11587.1 transcriptional regulator [Mycobacterium asiaticum DSM 44297]
MPTRVYNQNCPIARGLDVIGERWTLLIVRELIGGPRRYSDLRAELPGIATNLLAQRLKELQESGLIDRTDLPAPIGRTVYTLTDDAWQRVLPIVQAIALFGLDKIDAMDASAITPLNGFLAGLLLSFNPATATDLDATYRIDIDGRRFEFAVSNGHLAKAQGEPAVTVTATAADLIASRLGGDTATRKSALRRVRFEGDRKAVAAMRDAFALHG